MAEHQCNCGHEHSAQPKSKYEEALAKYNCNINDAGKGNSTQKNSYMSCIINQLGYGVYTNCLYNQNSSGAVIYECYQQTF